MNTMSNDYFGTALSDFVHDVASGGAIRHLTDLDYSLKQIISSLTYPENPSRVQKVMYRYMLETEKIVYQLPENSFIISQGKGKRDLYNIIKGYDCQILYISCPFGLQECLLESIQQKYPELSLREADYLCGIPWEKKIAYHRLTGRMRDIAKKVMPRYPEDFIIYNFATKSNF